MSTVCCPSQTGLLIGATVQVIDRLFNANDTDTVVTDAAVKWTMPDVDDGGSPATGAMSWDATFHYNGTTGWYVGAISAAITSTLTDGEVYNIQIEGSGGSLLGIYHPEALQEEARA